MLYGLQMFDFVVYWEWHISLQHLKTQRFYKVINQLFKRLPDLKNKYTYAHIDIQIN